MLVGEAKCRSLNNSEVESSKVQGHRLTKRSYLKTVLAQVASDVLFTMMHLYYVFRFSFSKLEIFGKVNGIESGNSNYRIWKFR